MGNMKEIKDTVVHVKIDKPTLNVLDDCVKKDFSNRSVILRKGIDLVKKQLEKAERL